MKVCGVFAQARLLRYSVAGIAFVRFNALLWFWGFRNKTVTSIFSSVVKKHPHKIAFYYEDEVWTFAQAEEFSNQLARYFRKEGYEKGDCIALLLENRPEFPCIWLGLSKIGIVTALINTNLVNDSLLHSINVSNCKAVVFGSNFADRIQHIMDDLKSFKLYQFHEKPNETTKVLPECTDLKNKLNDISSRRVKTNVQLDIKDPLLYVYTSGTTGLPKAAVITNLRFMFMVMSVHFMARFKSNDVFYNPLPLYHSGGGMVGIGQTILAGNTTAIRKKFSASRYWTDCVKYKCTVAEYVGEVCRYVLAVPHDKTLQHSVRAVFGNGLRPQIWNNFVKRFNIKEVFEIYGATEGISNMMNIDNTVGCVGFVPRYFRWMYPLTLIKCDETTGEPVRDSNGHCIECEVNEAGLVIAKINPKKAVFSFKGYSDKTATEQKILQNVFRDGDLYFNSGDILIGDQFGSYYFKDRTGDTFRWKGENVSTSEVEGIISNITALSDAVVFGVEIPGTEGRAGMAAIVDTTKSVDLDALSNGLKSNLPSYAIPIFIRVLESVPMTGTYKLKKLELQAEGYNVENIKENVYFYNSKLGKYEPLTKEYYEQIVGGKLRL